MAARKGMPLAELERWLMPNLNYDPTSVTPTEGQPKLSPSLVNG